jgi:hypothetical protein
MFGWMPQFRVNQGGSIMNIQADDLTSIVDLQRYPIHALESAQGQQFLADCQAHMATHGWLNLDGFVREGAISTLSDEVNGLLPHAEKVSIRRNIYGAEAEDAESKSNLARHELTYHALYLADDQIPDSAQVKQLYCSDTVTDFVRRVQCKETLYQYGDEFQALNIIALPPGNGHAWHYDHNECAVTLLLQAAEQGGEFFFIPNSRDRNGNNERTEIIEQFLAGDMSCAKTIGRSTGAFTLFRGEFAVHGVTEVEGTKLRISAVLTYDEKQGRIASDEINIRIYGPRVERILAQRRTADGRLC